MNKLLERRELLVLEVLKLVRTPFALKLQD